MRMKVNAFLIGIILLVGVHTPAFSQGASFFVLGPGDVLEISVWKDDALTRDVAVRPDGKISFPLIGDVVASGKSVEELRVVIQEKLRTYVPDAPVSVLTKQINSTQVYVVGKVNQPGAYLMSQQLTVMQLLAMAGGLNAFADQGKILILRQNGEKQEAMNFDYKRVSGGRELDLNIPLLPNDTIIVP
jgi:polysaccharide biosynthesis/export protein